jgi:hypothetical protein
MTKKIVAKGFEHSEFFLSLSETVTTTVQNGMLRLLGFWIFVQEI